MIKQINIIDEELNIFKESKLNRIIICFNNGQGDHCVYNYKEVVNLLKESTQSDCSSYNVDNLKPSQILDFFYKSLDLNGNNTDAIYFDDEYKIIHWIKK